MFFVSVFIRGTVNADVLLARGYGMFLSDVFVADSMLLLYFTRGCVREKKGEQNDHKKTVGSRHEQYCLQALISFGGYRVPGLKQL